jgi:hypothetical protein
MFGQCSAITDPPSRVLVLENEEIDPDARDNIVLIQPQKVKLELRPGDDDQLANYPFVGTGFYLDTCSISY